MCINCTAGLDPAFCLLGENCGIADNSGENQAFGIDSLGEPEPEKEMLDPISTGRKRAARLYPLKAGQVCEWAWKKNAGGGVEPIYGCAGRPAVHIHHGPDKSTLNNERENISLVCNFCHNRWHTANDKYYAEPRPAKNTEWIPTLQTGDMVNHSLYEAVKASKHEILMNELMIPEGGKDKK